MIEAGTETQLEWGDGNWIFLDIGFSGARNARGRICGLVIGDGEPECVNFPEAKQRIVHHIATARSLTNLMIEAPLSVCFTSDGRPAGRSIERREGERRYWYTGPGCAVMVAAMYLVEAIGTIPSSNGVRLFEAFISYKERGGKSGVHKDEAATLRDAVRNAKAVPARIVPARELAAEPDDKLTSAFRVMGVACGVPAVIML